MNTFIQHILSCPQSALLEGTQGVAIEGESQQGLASIIGVNAMDATHMVLKLETSAKVTCPRGSRRWECNIAAVWGQMATGGGHKKLERNNVLLGMPTMSRTSFIKTEI